MISLIDLKNYSKLFKKGDIIEISYIEVIKGSKILRKVFRGICKKKNITISHFTICVYKSIKRERIEYSFNIDSPLVLNLKLLRRL